MALWVDYVSKTTCVGRQKSLQNEDYYSVGMRHAVRSLEAIAAYCPNLPVPRVYGYSIDKENATFCYYFMDWIEGKTLLRDTQIIRTKVSEKRGQFGVNITIPEKIVTQLASFFYDLTTYSIPKEKSSPKASHIMAEL
jgi:aminoglycoside phosphotransferase (APT) family kinase protein